MILEAKNFNLEIANKTICHELHLQIQPGDVWGVMGANGSGKTTLLHALARLYPYVGGEIWLKGKKISTYSQKEMACHLGILLQDTQSIFSQTVFEFCLAGRYPHVSYFSWESRCDHHSVRTALAVMGLDKLERQEVGLLSGGERRRLAIATLLTQSPTLYLLDELTNHLDLYYQIKVLNHFKNLVEKNVIAVMMSLHDVNLVQYYCNKVLMLFGEGDVLYGSPCEVLTVENVSRLYQHPLQRTEFNNGTVWLPCFDYIEI